MSNGIADTVDLITLYSYLKGDWSKVGTSLLPKNKEIMRGNGDFRLDVRNN